MNQDITRDGSSGRVGEKAHDDALGRGNMLRPDVSLFPLDDGLVAFSEASQSLVGLNATAAFIARKLQMGTPTAELAEALVCEQRAAADDAQRWVQETIEALASQGLLRDGSRAAPAMVQAPADINRSVMQQRMPPYVPFEAVVEAHYRLLNSHVLIRYAHRAQMRMVDCVIGHLKLAEPAAPALVIDIANRIWDCGTQMTSYVYCDGRPEGEANRLSHLGPIVKGALWVASVNAHDFLLDLHAGVVGQGDRCVLLPAASGSGKSSLTAALAHSGLGYYSDEVALVERGSFLVPPVPLAVCIKSTGWELMSRYYPHVMDMPMHRRADRKQVRYVPPPPEAVRQKPARVSHIFFPLYIKDEPTRLTRMGRCDALARLMDQCLAFRMRLDQGEIQELLRWIGGIDCYALTFSSLDEAVALVRSTAFP